MNFLVLPRAQHNKTLPVGHELGAVADVGDLDEREDDEREDEDEAPTWRADHSWLGEYGFHGRPEYHGP